METTLNCSSHHPFSKFGENENLYRWDRTLVFQPGFSPLTAFLVIIGGLIFIVKNLIVTKRGKQINVIGNVAVSSIVRVPWHVMLQYMLQHRGDFPKIIASLNQRFGSAWQFRIIGIKNFVFLNNAEMLHKLLSSGDPGHLSKPPLIYDPVLIGQVKDGLASSDVSTWKSHRKVLAKAFTYESLRYHLSIFDEHAKKLVLTINDTLAETEISPQNVNQEKSLHSLIHVSAFGMILQIVTGRNILSDHDIDKAHKLFDRCKEIVSYRLYRPHLWFICDWLWNLHPLKRELDCKSRQLEKINEQIMKKTRETMDTFNNENTDKILSRSLVEIMIRGGLSDKEISSEVATFLLLGHETVSMSANLLMFNLAVHPEYQKKCRDEIDQMFDTLDQSYEELTVEKINDLKYLEMCIKENLRLYPTAPGLARELESNLVIDENTTLQSGDIIAASPYFIHRSSEYYSNPTVFDPSRHERNRGLVYIPFSSGPRNCIGWKMAILELKVLAAYILRNFEAHTTHPKDYLVHQFDKCIWPCADVGVRLRKRQ